MYNADRRSQEFIDGVHYFICVAEVNTRNHPSLASSRAHAVTGPTRTRASSPADQRASLVLAGARAVLVPGPHLAHAHWSAPSLHRAASPELARAFSTRAASPERGRAFPALPHRSSPEPSPRALPHR